MFSGFMPTVLLYTDPGTGTLILQLLIAAFFGALFYIRYFAKRIGGFFSRNKVAEDTPVDAPASEGQLPDTSSSLTDNSSRVNSKV
jgi:hypothetical protein